jgi:hypothetical protein
LFDQDSLGQALADAQPGVAHLAYNAGLAAEEFDFLFFAEAHFAQAMGHLGRGGKLLDAHVNPGPHGAERTQERLGTHFLSIVVWAMQLVHHAILRESFAAGKRRSAAPDTGSVTACLLHNWYWTSTVPEQSHSPIRWIKHTNLVIAKLKENFIGWQLHSVSHSPFAKGSLVRKPNLLAGRLV